MSLTTYQSKRRFDRTPEPKGRKARSAESALRFVIQKHAASRLHYDFRLELDGVLKSWAVPKGPSLDPAKKSLAVQVEDHPIEYGDFEGVIPKGEYVGGTVLLWDTGTWEPLHDPKKGLADGTLHFVLNGKKLHGEWSLVQMHGKAGDEGKNWLLMKLKDQFASKTHDILESAPSSVKSDRSMDEIAGARDDVWSDGAKQIAHLAGAVKQAMPESFSPQLAVLAEAPPEGDDWLHEIKFDGYRILARIQAGKVQLLTRNGKDWTNRFPSVAKALANTKADSAIIDGEMVVLDKQGRSDFQALQAMLKHEEKAEPVYYAFDLPYCNGFDLRETPLIQRKEQLAELLKTSKLTPRVNYSEHISGDGHTMIDKACGMSLEGIISKRADSPYVSRRYPTWLKSKCGQRQEFIVIGYTDPQGHRSGFGSLLLGYHDDHKRLVYAGRVGTGFDDRLLNKTLGQLRKIHQEKPPTDLPPPRREMRSAHWIKPNLVAEVKFSGWTRDGVLRHPAFVAFRSDKSSSSIVREMPVSTQDVEHEDTAPAQRQKQRRRPPGKSLSNKSNSLKESHAGPPARGTKPGTLSIAGITLSHPDKVYYPDSGTTKLDLANYYEVAQQWMIPHVVRRPLALVRCPEGISKKCFFQRNWSDTLPAAVGKVNIGPGNTKEFHVTISDEAGIISLVQMGVLEIHTWNCRNDDVEHPDQIIFDLDPGPDVPWARVITATRRLNRALAALRLPTFLKTSGGKGLHITIPIEPTVNWDACKSFSAAIAKSLAQESDLFVANMRKDLRGGKIYLDYNRNGRSATAVAPYSTRARAGAPVAMPISWEDLGKLKSADHFKVETARRYLEKRKSDPWHDFERSRVDLRKIIEHRSVA